ncbi:MAG: hypothetical protein GXN96_00980 [Aquificae bacterium]|nr:hypothetical protein [Aquificota bacterium]
MKGFHYEELAVSYLRSKGYRILGRNLRSPFGEIDVLAEDSGRKVVVEVKGGEAFNPVENFTGKKLQKLVRTAFYLLGSEDFRIDLVIVHRGKITHYKSVGYDYGGEEEI